MDTLRSAEGNPAANRGGAAQAAAKQKNDAKYVAAARELRDRYLEQVNAPGSDRLLPSAQGKYDVSRQLEAAPSTLKQAPLLDAA